MDNDRLDALFAEAVQVAAPELPRWLDEHCGDDAALRHALVRLLAGDAIAEGVLERAPELLATAILDAAVAPERFGVWRVTGALGAGGMGEVWLAERDDGEFTQRAAIKQVAWPTPGLLQRFRKERQILAGLEHPGIARLIDGGVDAAGCPWLAMEYVEGIPIARWVRERNLGVRATLNLLLHICDAIQYAHRNLVVHSDIKPSNILVGADGAPRLLDFGIAKVLAQGGDSGEGTRTMAQLLTPDYAAPEMLAGGAITTSVDVYALGVLLYELLTGGKPNRLARGVNAQGLPDDTAIRLPSAAINPALVDARARRRTLRGDLDRIILTAMAPQAARRYDSVESLASDARNWLAGRAINARGQGRWYRAGKFIRRHRAGFAATLLVFAILLAATLYSLQQARLARAEAARANAVRNFVVGVFEQTDPDSRQGKPVTANELLDMGARQLDNASRAQPFHSEMQGLLGYLYWQVGERLKGDPLLRAAVARPGAAAPEVRAQNLFYLAQTELDENKFPAARAHAEQARALALQAGNAGKAIASDIQLLYANILLLQGDQGEAREILLASLRDNAARFGSRSEQVAQVLTNLAVIDLQMAHYVDAVAHAQQAIAIESSLHGRASSANLENFLTMAEAKTYKGDPVAGQRDMREAVAIATKVYGPSHATTLSMRANLYALYTHNEQYAAALAGHLELVRLIQHDPNFRAGQLIYAWYGVANDYLGLGRYAEATRAAQAAIADWQHMPNPDPDYYILNFARTALAEAMMMSGRFEEAAADFATVIRSKSRHSASDSGSASSETAQLGNVYRLQHRYAEAVATTDKALASLPPKAGATPRRANIEMFAALAKLDAGDLAGATAMAAKATRAASVAFKRRPIAQSAFQYMNARIALAQHRPAAAEVLLRQAAAVRAAFPNDDPRKVEVQVALIGALQSQDKTGEAKPLRAQVEPLLAASKSPYFADLRKSLDAR